MTTKRINSRAKGARGERELASKLREYGYCKAERDGQQGKGNAGEHPDVKGIDGMHIECKRVERLQLSDAMCQSIADAREGEMPVVMHKKNNEEWFVTLRLDDFMKLWRSYD